MSDPESPSTFGAYDVVAKVGEGGMGIVHLGEDGEGNRVAIKVLRPHVVSDEHSRARMAREVTSMRRVRSPHVAEVIDADPWGETPYVVTRYVAGLSLHDEVAQRGPLTGHDLNVFALGLAKALYAVHAADVMHRDVKPSNVLVEGTHPVLIDFGLAQLADDLKLTQSGWLIGTPGYLAPEILFGDDPTPAADVHSWASTVVFAATGHGPFGKGPAVAVMDRVRRGDTSVDGVPYPLVDLCRQALSPDLRERPSTAQLVQWLTALVEGRQLPWRPTTPSNQPQHPASAPSEAAAARARHEADATQAGRVTRPRQGADQSRPPRVPAVGLGLGCAAAVTLATLWHPVLGLALLVLGMWSLRTVAIRVKTVTAWQRKRGVRRSDSTTATLSTPWFAAVAIPGTLAGGGIAVLDGIAASLISYYGLLRTDAAAEPMPVALLIGAFVAVGFAWWGPFNRDLRLGARKAGAVILRPGWPTAAALIAVWVVVALLALEVMQTPGYSRFEPHEWRGALGLW